MNAIRYILLILWLTLSFIGSGLTQYLYLDSALTITTPSTFDSVRITSTGILTADDSITVLGNMIIDSGGVVTHSLRLLEGLRLHVIGTLEVKSGGAIDVSAKGLRGGAGGGSLFGKDGEAYDSLDQIVAGAVGGTYAGNRCGAGASYGGLGANSWGATNPCYGLLEDPHHLGAGGGGTEDNWRAGGHGGGRITINADVCIVDGVIRANGGNGAAGSPFSAGGGSGGGVRINVGSMAGTGTIEANGGNGFDYHGTMSGSGGGGRIAIYYDLLSFPAERISARGNTGGYKSGAGMIYLKDNAQTNGDIIVDNANISCQLYTPWKSGLTTIQNLSVMKAGKLDIGEEINIEGQLLINTGGIIGRP